jgi:heme oxygenase-like protein
MTTTQASLSRPRARASLLLRRKISLVTPPFAAACQQVFGHARIADVLPRYLMSTHSIIRTTVPLMELAIHRAQAMAGTDPVAQGVAEYLTRHVEEERHHDDWLVEDLELMGVDRDAVHAGIPTPTIASLAGAQYYWVLHVHPLAFLGYLAFMEGFPPRPSLVEGLIERTGFPGQAFRTMILHGELDAGHSDELDETLDALRLSRDHEALLGLSAISTADLLCRSLHEVLEDFTETS